MIRDRLAGNYHVTESHIFSTIWNYIHWSKKYSKTIAWNNDWNSSHQMGGLETFFKKSMDERKIEKVLKYGPSVDITFKSSDDILSSLGDSAFNSWHTVQWLEDLMELNPSQVPHFNHWHVPSASATWCPNVLHTDISLLIPLELVEIYPCLQSLLQERFVHSAMENQKIKLQLRFWP